MAAKRGLDLKLYYNTASYATPTWSLITNVEDLTLGLTKAEGNASNRSQVYAMFMGTQKLAEFSWKMVNNPADAATAAIQAAYDADPGTLIELAFADGLIATTGTKYRRFESEILDISEDQPLAGVSMISVKAKPTYTANAQGVRTTT